uniref:Uncharacterized protein n=1 Tax=viral metagenome TaxID=1070528 RepID=A0A6C0B8T8_9ZZZZ
MYKGKHTPTMTNGIHKDWESLPPLQNPDTLKEQTCSMVTEEEFDFMPISLNLPPKMVRCREKTLFTEEEYKKMEHERFYSKVDPSAIEDIDEWTTTFQAQEERDRRLNEAQKQKRVAHL